MSLYVCVSEHISLYEYSMLNFIASDRTVVAGSKVACASTLASNWMSFHKHELIATNWHA